MARQCECTEPSGSPCGVQAAWAVSVGTRVTDRQLSCGRHLNRVCWAMVEAEMPRHAYLTLVPVGSWEEYL